MESKSLVALLAEGVDRNSYSEAGNVIIEVALLAEGVDRNFPRLSRASGPASSPSSRRAWIEIRLCRHKPCRRLWSPSSRRAWIEISSIGEIVPMPSGRPPRGGRG